MSSGQTSATSNIISTAFILLWQEWDDLIVTKPEYKPLSSQFSPPLHCKIQRLVKKIPNTS